MTIVGNEPTIPAGMKRWHGGDSAPADWDQREVLWQRYDGGTLMSWVSEGGSQWSHDNWPKIIAYTPRAPDEAREEAVEAAYRAVYGPDMDPFQHPEGWDFAAAIATAVQAALRPSARDGECERLTADLIVKADQCDRLAEVSRAPACFEYRAKAIAYREAVSMIRAALSADRSDPAGVE